MSTTTLTKPVAQRTAPSVWGSVKGVFSFFKENYLFTIGFTMLLGLLLVGLIGGLFIDPDMAEMGAVPLNLPPSPEYPLGTEGFGRDMSTLMIMGIPTAFKIGLLAGGVGVAIGVIIGLFAGYYRGYADVFFSSLADVLLVIPTLAILITISAYVRTMTVELMALIVGMLAWPLPARVIRAQTLSMRERLFVQVGKLNGQNDFEIIFLQIFPNLTSFVAAAFVGTVSGSILAAVGLEVLGLGPQLIPTIGRTLYQAFARSALGRGLWWWWGPPVAILAVIFLGLFLMSVSLDKYANPRLKGQQRG